MTDKASITAKLAGTPVYAAGSVITITPTFTDSVTRPHATLNTEIHDPTGAKAAQKWQTGVTLKANTAHGGDPLSYPIPTDAAGVYTVYGGIYDANDVQLYWQTLMTFTVVASSVTPIPPVPPDPPTGTFGIKVVGKTLVGTKDGKVVQLRGANVSGLEGIPFNSDPWRGNAPNFNAMKSWGMNVIRIPLNEANWMGLCDQSIKAGVTGPQYQAIVAAAVKGATDVGMYVVLDLHRTAVPDLCTQGQPNMADAQYSPTFWSQVATAFKGNAAVMFELINEAVGPHLPPLAADWQNYVGGQLRENTDTNLQAMLDAIRKTNAANVVMVPGLMFQATFGMNGNGDNVGMIPPKDPLNQLCFTQHYYSGTQYQTSANWALANLGPVVVTEYGDNDGTTNNTTALYAWADPINVGYIAWTWDWSGWGGAGNFLLISDANGTVFPESYARAVNAHYLARAAAGV